MKLLRLPIALFLLITSACSDKEDNPDMDYRQEMRNFVTGISNYAGNLHPGFIVIPQNGQELITTDGEGNGPLATGYLAAIDGQAREDLFYGYEADGVPTPAGEREYMEEFLDRAKADGKQILVTDYCSEHLDMLDSYNQNAAREYISFAANDRELNNVPEYPNPVFNENSNNIANLSQAKNFLYLINPEKYESKNEYLDLLRNTNYDLLIIDLFFKTQEQLSVHDVEYLKLKANGSERLVICYMSIGEAENYRYYWDPGWEFANPEWLEGANPDWPGNYKVRYWDPEWQKIIYGNDNSYLKKIIDAGFDGVYLDIIDAFEYFE